MSNTMTLPLTEAQKGIWLGQQKLGNSPCYNTAEIVHFSGELDLARLAGAIFQVLKHTAALNMVFVHSTNGLVQKYCNDSAVVNTSLTEVAVDDIHQAIPVKCAQTSQMYCFSSERKWLDWQQYWLKQTLDLTRERPYRQALIQRPNGEYSWYLQIHHIACDGFSYALIRKQLKQAYDGFFDCNAEQGFVRYKALIESSLTYQGSDKQHQDEEYWRQQFERHYPLSFKQAEMAGSQPMSGNRVTVRLQKDFYSTLKGLAIALNNDWPSLLKAALVLWLHECTGYETVTLGCPEMNRPFGPAMATPALQMNILPLTVSVSEKDELIDLAKKIQRTQQTHRAHTNYRYENFSTLLKSTGSEIKRPFGPIVNILPFDRSLDIGRADVRVQPLSAGPVEDIAIYFLLNEQNALESFIEFHPGLYSRDECRWLCKNLSRWLYQKFNQAMDHGLEQTAVMACRSLLTGPLPSDANGKAKGLLDLLEHQRLTQAQREALRWFDSSLDQEKWQSINYQTLCTYIADVAQTFAQAGLQKGQKCIIALPRSPWSIISMFACLALNAEFIGIDIDGPDSRIQNIMDDCVPKLVVVSDIHWLAQKNIALPQSCSVLSQERIARFASKSRINTGLAMGVFCQDQDFRAVAYSIYTSGSTGSPKAVQISQQSLNQFVKSANKVYQIGSEDHVLQFAPLYFDACIEEIFISLCHGATLTMRSQTMVESFAAFNQTLVSLDITVLDLPTAFWHEWVSYNAFHQSALPSTLERVIIGGEACKPEAIDDFFAVRHSATLINTYGPSEATVIASAKTITRDNQHALHPASIGTPLSGRKAYVLDENYKFLPKGIVGQLVLAGDSLAEGYFGQAELTAAKFITLDHQERVYLTGDRGAIGDFDEILFYGRIDDEIKISGQRIHPAEITRAIEQLLIGYQVAVITLEQNGLQQIFAIVAHDQYTDFGPYQEIKSLKQRLLEKLPVVQIPSQVFVTNRLPLTRAGKVDRGKLKEDVDGYIKARGELDSTQTKRELDANAGTNNSGILSTILSVWRNVLGLNEIAASDDFFVLGGTSLQLLQVATRLSQALQGHNAAKHREITVSDLFKYPKARDLARAIDNFNTGGDGTGIGKSAVGNESLTFLETGFKASQLPSILQVSFRKNNRQKIGEHFLLTGASGFVGIQLLHGLLEKDVTVTCIVRAHSDADARAKLTVACVSQALADISRHQRLQIQLADLAAPNWGLSETALAALAVPLTGVIHNGAITSIVRDYQSLEAVNVGATETALKLAHLAAAPIHYISTIAIAGDTLLAEEFIEVHQYLSDGYQQSKWDSENLIQQRTEFNQPYSIFRLPRVVGNPDTGFINPKDLIWRIAAASNRAQLLPMLDFEEPWLAANEAARFIVQRILNGQQAIYNCIPNQNVSIGELLAEIAAICQITQAPLPAWLDSLEQSRHSEDQALRAFFMSIRSKNKIHVPVIERQNYLQYAAQSALRPPGFKPYLRNAFEQKIISAKKANDDETNYESITTEQKTKTTKAHRPSLENG